MKAPKKIDLRKELRHLYEPPTKEVVEVEVPEMRYLMVDGEAVEALYSLILPQVRGQEGSGVGLQCHAAGGPVLDGER